MFEQNRILKHHEMSHQNLRQCSASQAIILDNKFTEILLVSSITTFETYINIDMLTLTFILKFL